MLDPGEVRRRLLEWYRCEARDLPWRRTGDPYAIWISEVMLQQTRVEVVRDRWQRFLDRFPTVEDLAAAPRDEVLAEWSGLGYYRRARNLHAAAREIVSDHGGVFPRDPATARALPGVGAYTAGAVTSIAFDREVPAVDGNVQRVLSRVLALEGDPRKGATASRIREVAASLVEGPEPGDWNQALMELGATVCTPRSPRCERCPLSGGLCRAETQGRQEELPALDSPPAASREHLISAVLLHGDRVLLGRDQEGVVSGMWEPPLVAAGAEEDELVLRDHLVKELGMRPAELARREVVRHTVMRRHLRIAVFRGRARRGSSPGWEWLEIGALGSLPLSALTRKILEEAGVPAR